MEIVLATQGTGGAELTKPVEDGLINALRAAQIDVLIVDPFVSAHRVSENDNMAIDLVAKTFGRIAEKANCAVELVHHVRKTNGAEITAEDGRGASALIAAARSVRVLNPMSKEEAASAGVEAWSADDSFFARTLARPTSPLARKRFGSISFPSRWAMVPTVAIRLAW